MASIIILLCNESIGRRATMFPRDKLACSIGRFALSNHAPFALYYMQSFFTISFLSLKNTLSQSLNHEM